MKTYTVRMAGLAAAVVMMSGSAFAGQTQAERERALRLRADPENALGWEIRSSLAPREMWYLPR